MRCPRLVEFLGGLPQPAQRRMIDPQKSAIRKIPAKVMADEKTLLDDLCAYRDVLCLPDMEH